MTLYPDVQKRAQVELDSVLGSLSRLPRFEDRPKLPYIDAIVLEVLRWNPSVPLGESTRYLSHDSQAELLQAWHTVFPKTMCIRAVILRKAPYFGRIFGDDLQLSRLAVADRRFQDDAPR